LYSVVGIIAVPGMMTGAILGGSSVEQAARLQMIIMFMISSSSGLAAIFTTLSVISVTVDKEHRIRNDRIDDRMPTLWRLSESLSVRAMDHIMWAWYGLTGKKSGFLLGDGAPNERTALLSN
jgi:hypothetical protein